MKTELHKGLHRSQTIDQLITQNDSLTAQLNMAMKKMATLESDWLKAKEEKEYYQYKVTQMTDQSQFMAEKDALWHDRFRQVEKEKLLAVETMQAIELKLQKQNIELQRMKRFHQRIQTVVAPYIDELKRFSKDKEFKAEELYSENTSLKREVGTLREQIMNLSKNYSEEKTYLDELHNRTIEKYESDLKEMAELRERTRTLEKELADQQAANSRIALANESIENEMIATRHKLTESEESARTQLNRFDTEMAPLKTRIKELDLEFGHARDALEQQQSLNASLVESQKLLHTQMETLRMLYNERCTEIERQKLSMAALERLNTDLAEKLQDQRIRHNHQLPPSPDKGIGQTPTTLSPISSNGSQAAERIDFSLSELEF